MASGLDKLLKRHAGALAEYRARSIETLAAEDEHPVMRVFSDFEALLGPVGAAKVLHVLAPRFFRSGTGTSQQTADAVS